LKKIEYTVLQKPHAERVRLQRAVAPLFSHRGQLLQPGKPADATGAVAQAGNRAVELAAAKTRRSAP